jgi:hypothetical protein
MDAPAQTTGPKSSATATERWTVAMDEQYVVASDVLVPMDVIDIDRAAIHG